MIFYCEEANFREMYSAVAFVSPFPTENSIFLSQYLSWIHCKCHSFLRRKLLVKIRLCSQYLGLWGLLHTVFFSSYLKCKMRLLGLFFFAIYGRVFYLVSLCKYMYFSSPIEKSKEKTTEKMPRTSFPLKKQTKRS